MDTILVVGERTIPNGQSRARSVTRSRYVLLFRAPLFQFVAVHSINMAGLVSRPILQLDAPCRTVSTEYAITPQTPIVASSSANTPRAAAMRAAPRESRSAFWNCVPAAALRSPRAARCDELPDDRDEIAALIAARSRQRGM